VKLIMESELRDGLVAYLRSRPLGEVLDGYVALMNLPPAPEPPAPAAEPAADPEA
jgi:hypothetical protein